MKKKRLQIRTRRITLLRRKLLFAIVVVGGIGIAIVVPKTTRKDVAHKASAFAENREPTVTGTRFQTNSQNIAPKNDSWPSEMFADAVKQVTDQLKKDIAIDLTESTVIKAFARDFEISVRQVDDSPQIPNKHFSVWRTDQDAAENRLSGKVAIDKFRESILPAQFSSNSRIRTAKIITSQLTADGGMTRIRFESATQGAPGIAAQQISTWDCVWKWKTGTAAVLQKAEMVSSEMVVRTGSPTFIDKTNVVIGSTDSFQRQLSFGMQHWLAQIENAHGMTYFSKHGLAIADVNGDGRDDLYVCQPGGLPNRLYIQMPGGAVQDQSQSYGIDLLDKTSSVLFVDLDNDGDQDFAAATRMGLLVFENHENKRFKSRNAIPFQDTDLHGLSAIDFDQDGDLDLYQIVDFASAASRSQQGLPSFLYHNANDGGQNRLLRNDINPQSNTWNFEDVTDSVGLNDHNQRHSLAAAWEDYDNDGDADLYVANDYGANCLYENQGGHFDEHAVFSGVVDFGSGMSVTWGDYDRDGNMDLYVSNMFSSAGIRLTEQDNFLPELDGDGRRLYQRFAKGNSLFRNLGNGRFEETGGHLNVQIGRWAWGSKFGDINNDGWEDILVANGYITTDDTADL